MKQFYATAVTILLVANITFAVVITPTIADVSSENPIGIDRDANRTIDSSGLTGDGSAGSTHSNYGEGTMWTTVGNLGPGTDYDPYITFDLGGTCDVTKMRIWNFNYAGYTEMDVATLEVFTGETLGSMTSRGVFALTVATGANDYTGQDFVVTFTGVRYIKFDILTSHDGAIFGPTETGSNGGADGRSLTGLSEVRFEAIVAPEENVEINQSDGTTLVYEGGAADSYDIRLGQQPIPGATIQIKAIPSDPQIKLNAAAAGVAVDVSFDDQDWDTWKTITVAAKDDNLTDPNHISSISHIVTSDVDPAFDNYPIDDISVAIVENDTCGSDGYSKMDFNEDCHVNLEDVSMFAGQWLDTTVPNMPGSVNWHMEWFRDIKFYPFICWNPSVLRGGEISWSRSTQVSKEEYDLLYTQFDPTDFDADEWVSMAKAAGMKTFSFVAKHHDGFCMWDTQYTDYNVMNTPFGRDVVRELADACERQNFTFSLYYSICDWYQPDHTPYSYGGPGYELPPGQDPNFASYVTYMKNQLEELLTNYGPVGLLWYDGNWYSTWTEELGDDLEAYTRTLQPGIVMNNRVGGSIGSVHFDDNGDYDTPEQFIGEFNMDRPWETCYPLGDQWSFKPDDNLKPLKTVLHYLINIVGRDGNFLFDIAPMADGTIEPRRIPRFMEIGHWLKHNGESIYATRGGPYKPGAWGVSTRKDDRIYLHIINWNSDPVVLPALDKTITNSYLLTGGEVSVIQTAGDVTIDVPEYYRRDIDTIVVLELEGPAIEIDPIDTF